MKMKMVWIYSIVLAVLAIVLPLINIPLPIGNPNLGSSPVTLAALYLPWPVCIIIGLIKGVAASIITGRVWVEMPAGIGDAIMGIFTWWMAGHMHKSWAAILGQASRIVFTSGVVALCVSGAIALNLLTPATAPVKGLTASFFPDFGTSWLGITWPAILLSIAVNAVFCLVIVLLFSRSIENSLKKS